MLMAVSILSYYLFAFKMLQNAYNMGETNTWITAGARTHGSSVGSSATDSEFIGGGGGVGGVHRLTSSF